MHINIYKLPVNGGSNLHHCWTPVVKGKAVELQGQPCRSVEDAKRAAAEHLNMTLTDIKFSIHK